jgi:2-methylcitrate dehydratase PrpD
VVEELELGFEDNSSFDVKGKILGVEVIGVVVEFDPNNDITGFDSGTVDTVGAAVVLEENVPNILGG